MEERRCYFSRFHISLLNPSDRGFDHNNEVKYTHIAGTFNEGYINPLAQLMKIRGPASQFTAYSR